jgi:hypothetical protein
MSSKSVLAAIEAGEAVTIPEMAKALRMSVGGLYGIVRRGEVPGAVKVGGSVRIPASVARELLRLK